MILNQNFIVAFYLFLDFIYVRKFLLIFDIALIENVHKLLDFFNNNKYKDEYIY